MTDKALQLLGLFSLERPVWTPEEVASALGVAISSAYRVISKLCEAGLIDTITPGRYVLGPAVIQLDRQIRLTDPLVRAAAPVMAELIELAAEGTTIILCRAFRDTVLSIHQVGRGPQAPISYERGRPRDLFRGATSKAILAFLPPRTLKRIYGAHAAEIRAAGLGSTWADFLASLRSLRKGGYVLAQGEVDTGRVGIAAPILNGDRNAVASLSFVITASKADERTINRLGSIVTAGAREVERVLYAPAVSDREGETELGTAGVTDSGPTL